MSTDRAQAAPLATGDNPNLPWLIALAGYAAMYVPVYWWAAGSIWQSE